MSSALNEIAIINAKCNLDGLYFDRDNIKKSGKITYSSQSTYIRIHQLQKMHDSTHVDILKWQMIKDNAPACNMLNFQNTNMRAQTLVENKAWLKTIDLTLQSMQEKVKNIDLLLSLENAILLAEQALNKTQTNIDFAKLQVRP